MKHPGLSLCLISIVLLFFVIVPVAADAPTVTSITPNYGYGTSTAVTISGANFPTTGSVDVKLTMSGQSNITVLSVTPVSSTTLVCNLPLTTSHAVGTWNIVVVNNTDMSEGQKIDAFTNRAPIILTSITPISARANNITQVSVVGTGLSSINSIYLYKSGYSNITASSISPISSSMVNGTLTLTNANVDTYQVCIRDSLNTVVCGLSFKITSDAVGSIDVSSSPSGASFYLDGTLKGTTPITVNDLEVGSYKVILKKDGYVDWTRTAKVTNGGTTSYDAELEVKRTETPTATPVPTTAPTTVRTTRVSTITIPTTWSNTPAPTQESPLEAAVILGAIGIGFLIVYRKY